MPHRHTIRPLRWQQPLALFLLVFCWVFFLPSQAAVPFRIIVVLSDDSAPYYETSDRFRETIERTTGHAVPVEFETVILGREESEAPPDGPDPDLVVPVGTRAARTVKDWGGAYPVYNILITREVFGSVYPDHASTRPMDGRRVSAVFLEQPLHRQFYFIRLVLPRLKHCGVLLSERPHRLITEMNAASAATDIELDVVRFDGSRKPVDSFRHVIESNEGILALPDSRVLSPNRAKWLLYMAYQHRVPVIGFSRAIVDAGALGAVYSTPAQIGRQAAENIIQILLEVRGQRDVVWRLPEPRYPRYFEIAINHAVARSLSIDVKENQSIVQALTTLEQSKKWRAHY